MGNEVTKLRCDNAYIDAEAENLFLNSYEFLEKTNRVIGCCDKIGTIKCIKIKKYDKDAKPSYSGKRIKLGLYRSQDGILINADVNGAFNILRKNDSEFSYRKLVDKVGDYVKAWLHPTMRVLIK